MQDLFSAWNRVKVTHVALAMYVAPGTGAVSFQNRAFHGFVLNDPEVVRDYVFADGTVLHTGGGDFFYLPKGSSYRTLTHRCGGCYAINFDAVGTVDAADAEVQAAPFLINFRNKEGLFKIFKSAVREWKLQTEICRAIWRCWQGIVPPVPVLPAVPAAN